MGLITGLDQQGEIIVKELALEDMSDFMLSEGRFGVDKEAKSANLNEDQLESKNFKTIKLTFTSFQENQMTNFIPLIYQEKGTIENNRLLVYNTLE